MHMILMDLFFLHIAPRCAFGVFGAFGLSAFFPLISFFILHRLSFLHTILPHLPYPPLPLPLVHRRIQCRGIRPPAVQKQPTEKGLPAGSTRHSGRRPRTRLPGAARAHAASRLVVRRTKCLFFKQQPVRLPAHIIIVEFRVVGKRRPPGIVRRVVRGRKVDFLRLDTSWRPK